MTHIVEMMLLEKSVGSNQASLLNHSKPPPLAFLGFTPKRKILTERLWFSHYYQAISGARGCRILDFQQSV